MAYNVYHCENTQILYFADWNKKKNQDSEQQNY